MSLNEYLKKNNIIVTNEYFKISKNIHDEEIVNQIKLINDTNIILTNYLDEGDLKAPNNLGRNVEWVKVEIKKLEMDLVKRENKKKLNEMDIFLLNNGMTILSKAKEEIKKLKYIDYKELIKRSMKNHELCLGKDDGSNLRKNKFIEIGTLKKMSYNLKEDDIYNYLVKIRKYVDCFNKNYYISEFISMANLDNVSEEYLKILLSIPIGCLKQWHRYSYSKRGIYPEDYLVSIKKCLEYE